VKIRHPIASAFAALALSAAGAAIAQSGAKPKPLRSASLATVEAVQLSASVLRGGVSTPLAPGMELGNRDQIRTGTQSRVLLRTADGSTVKLGEQSAFFLENMRMRDDNVFEAAMRVAEGAFRFTTDALGGFRGRREVSVAVRSVTAGIRGTDLWGKSASEGQIVCLIEGRIEVASPGEKPFVLEEPLSFYALEGEVSRAIATVPPARFREWAAETEAQPGRGVATREGKWKSRWHRAKDTTTPCVSTRSCAKPATRRDRSREAQRQTRLQRAAVEFRNDAGRRVRRRQAETAGRLRAVRLQGRNVGLERGARRISFTRGRALEVFAPGACGKIAHSPAHACSTYSKTSIPSNSPRSPFPTSRR